MITKDNLRYFIDAFLSLSFEQRETLLEFLRDYDILATYWNPDHPVSPKSHIISTMMYMLDWNAKS